MRTRCESWPAEGCACVLWLRMPCCAGCSESSSPGVAGPRLSVETLCCAADRREALSISSGVSRVSLGVSSSDTLKKTEETAVTHRIKQLVLKGHFTQKLSFSHRLFSLMVFQISDFLSSAKHTNIIFC